MYKYIIISLAILASCKRPDKLPEFKKVDGIRVAKVTGKEATLKGDAYFYNPNDVKMTLRKVNIDVSLEGKKIGTINHTTKTKVPALSDFKVPVDANFDLSEVGLLKSILNVLGGKKMKAHYTGFIKLTVHGVPIRVPVDYEEDVKLR